MELEKFKSQLKETIAAEFPGGFLEEQITMGVEKHNINFKEYISINPWSNFQEWKRKIEKSVNLQTNNPGELLLIGIFLLALDKFKPNE